MSSELKMKSLLKYVFYLIRIYFFAQLYEHKSGQKLWVLPNGKTIVKGGARKLGTAIKVWPNAAVLVHLLHLY